MYMILGGREIYFSKIMGNLKIIVEWGINFCFEKGFIR